MKNQRRSTSWSTIALACTFVTLPGCGDELEIQILANGQEFIERDGGRVVIEASPGMTVVDIKVKWCVNDEPRSKCFGAGFKEGNFRAEWLDSEGITEKRGASFIATAGESYSVAIYKKDGSKFPTSLVFVDVVATGSLNRDFEIQGEGSLSAGGPTCSLGPCTFKVGDTITATSGGGFEFRGWGGPCSRTSGATHFVEDGDRGCSAIFRPEGSPPEMSLTIRFMEEAGEVRSIDGAIDCPAVDCDVDVDADSRIELEAVERPDFDVRWDNACRPDGTGMGVAEEFHEGENFCDVYFTRVTDPCDTALEPPVLQVVQEDANTEHDWIASNRPFVLYAHRVDPPGTLSYEWTFVGTTPDEPETTSTGSIRFEATTHPSALRLIKNRPATITVSVSRPSCPNDEPIPPVMTVLTAR